MGVGKEAGNVDDGGRGKGKGRGNSQGETTEVGEA